MFSLSTLELFKLHLLKLVQVNFWKYLKYLNKSRENAESVNLVKSPGKRKSLRFNKKVHKTHMNLEP